MAHPHPHPPHFHGGFRHVCMMEGPDPELRLSTLDYDHVCDENKRYQAEIQRLTTLLRENNISYKAETSQVAFKYISKNATSTMSQTSSTTPVNRNGSKKPRLPIEILLRILAFSLKSPKPVIDPFYNLRKENVTTVERSSMSNFNISCLAVCRDFHTEGVRMLVESNDFVFTQAAALDNFAKVSTLLRSTIKNVTLRVVGRYYDDRPRKLDLSGVDVYHEDVPDFKISALGRPRGMVDDRGIQSYCWYQLADFLRALQLPATDESNYKSRPKLFPNLTSMRIDLVNFCDHLPLGIASFAAIVRWHLGQILNELLVTGLPHEDVTGNEQMILRNLLRDGGLFSKACPAFISIKNGVKKLAVGEYKHEIMPHSKMKKKASSKESAKQPAQVHPEGGETPKSSYPDGTTIWKWVKEIDEGEKQWIEFHAESGRLMSEVELDEADDEEDDEDDLSWLPPVGGLSAIFASLVPPAPFTVLPVAPESDLSEFGESDDEIDARTD